MMVFFFFRVISVWTRCPQPIFPFSNSLSALEVRLTAAGIDRDLNHVAFSFAKQVGFEHSIRSPSPIITSKGEGKHPDKRLTKMTRQKVSPQFVVDRSSVAVRPDRDHGQCCSAATSLATASTGVVLLPSQMSQIAGHELQLQRKPQRLGAGLSSEADSLVTHGRT